MTHGHRTTRRSALIRALTALLALALLAAACGGKKSGQQGESGKNIGGKGSKNEESGLADAGKPTRGGKLVYGMEAETSGGYCLPESQLAISGILVARALYDTLTVPDSTGKYQPYLAKSVDHDATYKTWTIKVRDGVKFHDGSKLDATVVKNNLDAYRGTYKGRAPLLFLFVLQNVADVKTSDAMTVQVTMKKPWVAFDAYLFSSGRLGMMAQAQLDDTKSCDRKMIGTGPFKLKSWKVNQALIATANKDYWQKAPDGKPYPYVDGVEFRPIPEGGQRVNALQAGDINVMHTSSAGDIGGALTDQQNNGQANMYVTQKFGEVSYIMLNSSSPPFNDERMRRAFVMGGNRKNVNDIINNGLPSLADGPFAPGSPGYVADPGYPKYNVAAAKKLVQEYVKGGGKTEFTLDSASSPEVIKLAELIQQDAKKIGLTMKINPREQAALINDAIGGKFQAITWRNHPGGDPDTQYVWWYDGDPDPQKTPNPVNFGRINDPLMDKLLDQGRSEPDPAKRKKIYEDLNREFAKKVWNLWAWYTPWAVAETKDVHGILGPNLPSGQKPNPGLAVAHTLIGMWIKQ